MKHARIALGSIAACLLLCAGAYGNTESSANPYQGIVDRNVFGLRPPPPPPSNEPVRPPAPAVALTGITTISGKKLAFMNIQVPPKAGETAKPGPQSFMLGEGEREGEIEVLEIDDKGGTVKLNDYGVITNVPFAKVPSTPSAPVNTAAIPSLARPGGAAPNGALPQRSIPGLPARTMRLTNPNQPGTTSTGGSPSGYQTSALGAAVQSAPVPTAPFSERPTTPEEDVILTEAARELHRNDPKYPPLPPTPMTPAEDLPGIMAPGSRLPKGFQQQLPQMPQ